jgi:hypothetical protein
MRLPVEHLWVGACGGHAATPRRLFPATGRGTVRARSCAAAECWWSGAPDVAPRRPICSGWTASGGCGRNRTRVRSTDHVLPLVQFNSLFSGDPMGVPALNPCTMKNSSYFVW